MSSELQFRTSRLKTFTDGVKVRATTLHWPNSAIDVNHLVDSGFYFSPTKKFPDQITCFWCGKKERGFTEPFSSASSVSKLHLENSKRCPYSQIVSNLEQFIVDSDKTTFWQKLRKLGVLKAVVDPLSPASVRLRQDTFKDWRFDSDRTCKVSSRNLAKAGFYYSPVEPGTDRTICMYCDCPLEDWDASDDPLEEHKKNAFAYCYFLDNQPGATSSKDRTPPAESNQSSNLTSLSPEEKDAFDFSIEDLEINDQGTIFHGKSILPKRFTRKRAQELKKMEASKAADNSNSLLLEVVPEGHADHDEDSDEEHIDDVSLAEHKSVDITMEHSGPDQTQEHTVDEIEESSTFESAMEEESENGDSDYVLGEERTPATEKPQLPKGEKRKRSEKPSPKKSKKSKSQFSDDDFSLDEAALAEILNSPKKGRKMRKVKNTAASPSPAIFDLSNQNIGDYDESNISFIEKDVRKVEINPKVTKNVSASPITQPTVQDEHSLEDTPLATIHHESSHLEHASSSTPSKPEKLTNEVLPSSENKDAAEKPLEDVPEVPASPEPTLDKVEALKEGTESLPPAKVPDLDTAKKVEKVTEDATDEAQKQNVSKVQEDLVEVSSTEELEPQKDGTDWLPTSESKKSRKNTLQEINEPSPSGSRKQDTISRRYVKRFRVETNVAHSTDRSILAPEPDTEYDDTGSSQGQYKKHVKVFKATPVKQHSALDPPPSTKLPSLKGKPLNRRTRAAKRKEKMMVAIPIAQKLKITEIENSFAEDDANRTGPHTPAAARAMMSISALLDLNAKERSKELEAGAQSGENALNNDVPPQLELNHEELDPENLALSIIQPDEYVVEVKEEAMSPEKNFTPAVINDNVEEIKLELEANDQNAPSEPLEVQVEVKHEEEEAVTNAEDQEMTAAEPKVASESPADINDDVQETDAIDLTLSPSTYDEYVKDVERMDEEFVDASAMENEIVEPPEESTDHGDQVKDESFSIVADSASEAPLLLKISQSPAKEDNEIAHDGLQNVAEQNGLVATATSAASTPPRVEEDGKSENQPAQQAEADRDEDQDVAEAMSEDEEALPTLPSPPAKNTPPGVPAAHVSDVEDDGVTATHPAPPALAIAEHDALAVSSGRPSFLNVEASTPESEKSVKPAVSESLKSAKPAVLRAVSMEAAASEIQTLLDTIEYLAEISASQCELHNDAVGVLTLFIAAMPEEEENMTIGEWMQHNAATCGRTVRDISDRMIEAYEKEFDRVIEYVEQLQTVD